MPADFLVSEPLMALLKTLVGFSLAVWHRPLEDVIFKRLKPTAAPSLEQLANTVSLIKKPKRMSARPHGVESKPAAV